VLATKDKPIGVKYSNLLPIGGATDAYGNGVASRDGDLFIPVDATLPGGALPQNRAEIHLHGGLTPWISVGTPHQWTLPVGDPRNGYISDIAITAVGAGYTSPVVTIDPPQSVASGILAPINSAGPITAIVVTNGGANYTAAT